MLDLGFIVFVMVDDVADLPWLFPSRFAARIIGKVEWCLAGESGTWDESGSYVVT